MTQKLDRGNTDCMDGQLYTVDNAGLQISSNNPMFTKHWYTK